MSTPRGGRSSVNWSPCFFGLSKFLSSRMDVPTTAPSTGHDEGTTWSVNGTPTTGDLTWNESPRAVSLGVGVETTEVGNWSELGPDSLKGTATWLDSWHVGRRVTRPLVPVDVSSVLFIGRGNPWRPDRPLRVVHRSLLASPTPVVTRPTKRHPRT